MNRFAWYYYSQFYKGSYHLLFLSIAASMVQAALLFPITLLVRHIFDVVIPTNNYSLLLLTGVGIIALYLANMGLALWIRHNTLRITKISIQRFRIEILQKLYALSRHYYSQIDRSQLHTIAVQDTLRLDIMSNALVANAIPAILICAAFSVVLITLNWTLFLVSASIAPMIYCLSLTLGKQVKHQIGVYHQTFAVFSKGMLFAIQNMDLTRIQGAENYEILRQKKLVSEERRSSSRMTWLSEAYNLSHDLILVISFVVLLVAGGSAVAKGYMTAGEIFSFCVAVGLMKNYLYKILQLIPQIIEGNESLNTLYNLIQIKDAPPYSGTKQIMFKGKITLENIEFRYSNRPVLKSITLEINPHKTVAIIGPNGAGKSTIISLILGFYSPLKGQLYADDYSFSTLDVVHLRRQIGVVTQDAAIFAGTIFENITYGTPDVGLERVIEAAKISTAHDFIEGFPQGYETFIGECGMLISGGQRQRLAIARALLRRPKLLILDEPTNHLDDTSVCKLIENLKGMVDAPSILIISHDLSIVREAEYVYTLKDGRLIATEIDKATSKKMPAKTPNH